MILISGEALIDLIPDPDLDGRYDAVLGGSPYNVAIGLARLGGRASFISRISADANGEALAARWSRRASISRWSRATLDPTTLAFVMRGTAQTGSRYSFYLDATAYDGPWPFPEDLAGRRQASACRVVLGGRTRHGERVVAAMDAARAQATISFDPNMRPFVTPDRTRSRALVERQARLASIVKASEEDSSGSIPAAPVEETLQAWAAMGPRFCIATLGGRGRARLSRERADRRRAAKGRRSSTPSAPATASCRRCCSRWTAMARWAPARRRRRGKARGLAAISPPAPRRSPAPARAPIRRRLAEVETADLIERRGDPPACCGAASGGAKAGVKTETRIARHGLDRDAPRSRARDPVAAPRHLSPDPDDGDVDRPSHHRRRALYRRAAARLVPARCCRATPRRSRCSRASSVRSSASCCCSASPGRCSTTCSAACGMRCGTPASGSTIPCASNSR